MKETSVSLASSGVAGLDEILGGGFPAHRLNMIIGAAGTGKTTLGLQFALAGATAGESCLYVTLGETEDEVLQVAASHGWRTDDLAICHQADAAAGNELQTVIHPAEMELPAVLDALLERIEEHRPSRLVIDSLSELRILAREPRWFRRELIRLRMKLAKLECTVLLLDTDEVSSDAETLLGGSIRLERVTPPYGPDRRRLRVTKIRGHEFETGYHDMRISKGGISVYPRLVAARHRSTVQSGQFSTGIQSLDAMLHGGVDRGTAILFLGPTGTGKSTLALQCAAAAAARGERALCYVFDERIQTALQRSEAVGIPLKKLINDGSIMMHQIDPAELTPGELAHVTREHVERGGIRLVLLDSLNAYDHAMPGERQLTLHLHELIAYLSQKSVTSLLVATQHGLAASAQHPAGIDISYVADTVLLLRHFEVAGRLKKAVSVYKRRAGPHEHAVRELLISPGRIEIGGILPVCTLPSWVPPDSNFEDAREGGSERAS